MFEPDPDIFDDLFLGCACAAYIDQAREQGGPPDCEATRRRAYRYYEDELRAKNARAARELTPPRDADTLSENVEVSNG